MFTWHKKCLLFLLKDNKQADGQKRYLYDIYEVIFPHFMESPMRLLRNIFHIFMKVTPPVHRGIPMTPHLLHQSALQRITYQFGLTVDAHFFEHIGAVHFHRAHAD